VQNDEFLLCNLWDFLSKYLWVMGYWRVMGFLSIFPANQVGRNQNLWGYGEYGFLGIWVIGESTVL
jgi:hypothetical protein